MDIEIVEYYPTKKTETSFEGSLHIYLIDLKLDLRGCFVSYDKTRSPRWVIYLPDKEVFSEIDQTTNRFPVISFIEKKKYHSLVESLYAKARPYITENYYSDFIGKKLTEEELEERHLEYLKRLERKKAFLRKKT